MSENGNKRDEPIARRALTARSSSGSSGWRPMCEQT